MIIVSNTKELENIYGYNLQMLDDTELVQVLGGLEGKPKYSGAKYLDRVTYPAREIKNIIFKMHEIESEIPTNWNQLQIAKKIYETLGRYIDYNYDYKYSMQNPSNLSILLNRKGICAGYSLLFKEMMDRQGIECDYVRGRVKLPTGELGEKHAWNILHINGMHLPLELTWDSENLRNGNNAQLFATDINFNQAHISDSDEKQYNFTYLTQEQVNSIDTSAKKENRDNPAMLIHNAIEATYSKYKLLYGENFAREMVFGAMKTFIEKGDANGFTRDKNARLELIQSVNQEQMIDEAVKMYIRATNENNKQLKQIDISYAMQNAVQSTIQYYGDEQAEVALKDYLLCGDLSKFTRKNDGRLNMSIYSTQDTALNELIGNFIQKEIDLINSKQQTDTAITYFNAREFAQIRKPSQNVFKKAINWIKSHFKSRQNIQYNKEKKENDYQR